MRGGLKSLVVNLNTEEESGRTIDTFLSLPWAMYVKTIKKLSGRLSSCTVYFSDGTSQYITPSSTPLTVNKEVTGFQGASTYSAYLAMELTL